MPFNLFVWKWAESQPDDDGADDDEPYKERVYECAMNQNSAQCSFQKLGCELRVMRNQPAVTASEIIPYLPAISYVAPQWQQPKSAHRIFAIPETFVTYVMKVWKP